MRRFRLYIDETGTNVFKRRALEKGDRYLSLTGVVMDDDGYGALDKSLKELKRDIFGREDTVLHRREIVRREGTFEILNDPRIEKEFSSRLLQIIEFTAFKQYTVSIDKLEHLERYVVWQHDPYHYCMQCMLERFVAWMDRNNFIGDVLAEARGKRDDKRLKSAYHYFYEFGSQFVRGDVVRSRLTTKELKLDPKWRLNAGLQLADILAYPSHRAMLAERDGVEFRGEFQNRLVEILVRTKLMRSPRTHKIYGWGRKWLP